MLSVYLSLGPEGPAFLTVPLGSKVKGTPEPAGPELLNVCLLGRFPNYRLQKDDNFRHPRVFSMSALPPRSLPILTLSGG